MGSCLFYLGGFTSEAAAPKCRQWNGGSPCCQKHHVPPSGLNGLPPTLRVQHYPLPSELHGFPAILLVQHHHLSQVGELVQHSRLYEGRHTTQGRTEKGKCMGKRGRQAVKKGSTWRREWSVSQLPALQSTPSLCGLRQPLGN